MAMLSKARKLYNFESHNSLKLSFTNIFSPVAFLPLGNSNHDVVSLSIDFPSNSERDTPFHYTSYGYCRADWDGLRDHLRDVSWEDIFKLGACAADTEFC